MGGNSPGALSPRQRMINMMYLVLTAMLALNVSKEILNAFIVVNKGLEETNENFTRKTELLYGQMTMQHSLDTAKVQKYYDKTQEAKHHADELVEYIDHLKNVLIAWTESGDTTNLNTTWETEDGEEVSGEWKDKPLILLRKKDNYDKPTNLLVPKGDINPEKGYGYKLKKRIEKYKDEMRGIFEGDDMEEVEGDLSLGLKTENIHSRREEKELSWQTYNFYHSILAADIVMLNKIIAEVRNAEADVVSRLLSMISITDFKFDEVVAKVVPESNYILSGEKYKADIFVAAISKTQQPDVYVFQGGDSTTSREKILEEGTRIDSASEGMSKYIISPDGLGEKQYVGVIKMRKPGRSGEDPDDFKYYPFKSSYVVAEPTAVISATAVNVLYRGVDNPVEVSAPGVATANLSVTASNASVKGSGGSYQLRPGSGNETTVRVSADIGGESRFMGEMNFRVRRLPDPEVKIAGKQSGSSILKAELRGARLYPDMQGALFDVSYRVTRFTMNVTVGPNTRSYTTTGDRLSGEMKNIVNNLNRGSTVGFKNITVEGPDGSRPISGVFYTIQ